MFSTLPGRCRLSERTEAGLLFSLAKGNKNRGRRNRKQNRQGRGSSSFPQQVASTVQIDKVIRFKASAALSSASVKVQDLVELLCVAATTTTAYKLAQRVRLRKIEAWAPPASDGSSVTLSVEDLLTISGIASPSRITSDVTMGQSRPAHVVWTPRMDSALSKWLSTTGDVALALTAPTGTTFDVHLSLALQDDGTGSSVTAAVAGATVGALYIRALNSTNANNIPPVSFATI